MKAVLDHINLTVRDLQESMDWYRDVFEYEYLEGNLRDPQEPWAIVGKNDSMICMYENKTLQSTKEAPEGVHYISHFGIRVSDRGEWEERIKKCKLEILFGGVYKYPHSVSWYLFDPSGHEIEVSYSEGRPLKFK